MPYWNKNDLYIPEIDEEFLKDLRELHKKMDIAERKAKRKRWLEKNLLDLIACLFTILAFIVAVISLFI